jgi:hypothetical protein
MNPKETIVFIITAMVVMTMFASSAMAAISVDGDCSDWTNDWLANDPPDDPAGIGGYDLEALYQQYESGTDTLFIRIEVYGTPGDLDENGNTDTVCGIPPGDCTGVGPFEQYTLAFTSSGKSGATIMYTNNAVAHVDGDAAHGASCVEFSLSNANNYINPYDYCLNVTAGGMADQPGEDIMQVCFTDDPPDAQFDFTPITCGQGTLDATASTDDGTIVEYAWDFYTDGYGDYDDAYGQTPAYALIGTHNVGLKVTDDSGQSDTMVKSVTLTGDPVADAKADGSDGPVQLPANGKMVKFCGDDSSHPYSAGGAYIVSYTWQILGNPYYTTNKYECFDVFINETTTAYLTVEDNRGCTHTDSVTLRKPPTQKVPILTLPGLLALIGMMCIVGAGRIITRGRRS